MALWMYQAMNVLGQVMAPGLEEGEQAAPVVRRGLTFGDLQKSMRAEMNGETDDTLLRNMLLGLVVVVAVLALVLHLRQRRKEGGPPNNVAKLGRELSRAVRFPLGSRVVLWWVASSTQVPVAVLLISGEIFEASVAKWSHEPTFTPLRTWGAGRLRKLRAELFD